MLYAVAQAVDLPWGTMSLVTGVVLALAAIGDRFWMRRGDKDHELTRVREELKQDVASLRAEIKSVGESTVALGIRVHDTTVKLESVCRSMDRDREEFRTGLKEHARGLHSLDSHIRGNGKEGVLTRLANVENALSVLSKLCVEIQEQRHDLIAIKTFLEQNLNHSKRKATNGA